MTIGNLKNYSASQKGGAVVIGITALYFMFIVWVLPALSDDLWYSSCIGEYLSGHSSAPDWGKWWGSICAHFTLDNVRLGNLLSHLFIFLPHVISAVILSLGFPLLLILMTRLAGCPRPTFYQAMLFSLLFMFGVVWVGDIWHLNYIINYVWSGVMAFIFLISWQNNRLRPWIAFVVGLLTGWWHEGFSVPLLMAVAISFAVFNRYRTQRNVVMTIGLICGILILFTSPGALGRMGGKGLLPSLMDFVVVLKYDYVSVVFFLVMAVTMCIPSARRQMNMNVLLMLLVCSMASLCIHARININLRVGWFGQLTSLTGIYICMLALQPLLSGKKLILCAGKSVIWILSVLWAVHIVAVMVHAVEMRITFDKVYAMYKAEPEKVHFAKIKTEKDAWLITLMRPRYDEYTSTWCTLFIDRNTNRFPEEPWKVDNHSTYMLVVPEQLREVRAQSGVPVKGTPGLRTYDGYYFISADSVAFNSERLFGDCKIVFGDKDAILRAFTYTRFTSEADSRDYYWIYLNDSYLRSLFNPIKEVHLVD